MQTRTTLTLTLILAAAMPVSGQTTPVSSTAPKQTDVWGQTAPDWLAAASISVKEGYDSNLFGTSTNPVGHPDVANVSSAYTTLSTSLTFDLLAAAGGGGGGFLTGLKFGYAADYTAYTAVAREDNLRNTFSLQATGKSGSWSLSVDNPLVYVDGSREDPFYNTFTPPGFSAALQRRNQIQERNTSVLRYDAQDWFARAVDNAAYNNLLINEHDPIGIDKGYLNWVNRDDVNVGADLGYKLTPDFAWARRRCSSRT